MVKKNINKNKKGKINFRYNISEYWSLLRKYKWLFFGLLIVTLVTEGLFVVDKYLFKIIIDRGTEFIEGNFASELFLKLVLILAVIYISIVLIRSFGKWYNIHLEAILESKVILDLKQKYFNHIIELSHRFHTTHKTGSLISRMTRGAGAIEGITSIITFQFAPLIFQLIIVGISIAYFSLIPALVLSGMVFIFILYSFYIQQIQQIPKLEYISSNDREKGFIGDVFTNIDSIKYFGKEKNIQKLYSKKNEDVRTKALKHWGYYRWFDAGQVFILGFGTLLLIYFPLMDFLNKEITLGTLTFIYTVLGNVIGPMFGFVYGMKGFYRSMADLQDLFEYGKIENDIENKPHAKNLRIERGKIEFENVSFNYGKKRAFSLDDFNLKIKPNEKVAFVGHSGCGKTTLVKLLYRFYDVLEGKIKIDRKDIRDVKQESLRGELSIVPQECVLFDDSIFNNIKFSNPTASRREVWEAIRFAQLEEFILNLPQKDKTIVGERGVKLSGGEKQRVSIARAILANKKILVLDEATSSLDSQTEYDIQFALAKLLKNRTSIIIAHRLSTIMNADRIIVMKHGRIIQQGTHEKLINQDGEYKKLWDMQRGGYLK